MKATIVKFKVSILIGMAPLLLCAAPPAVIFPNPAANASNVPANTGLHWSPGNQELIANGTFEEGNLNGWTLNTQGFLAVGDVDDGTHAPLQFVDVPLAAPPMAGGFSYVAGAAQFGEGAVNIQQQVTLPPQATSATLTWIDQIWNFGGTYSDNPPQRFRVDIRSPQNALLFTAFSTRAATPQFSAVQKRRVDLSDFIGQTVRVNFTINASVDPLVVHVDNISLRVDARANSSYDVYFGTNTLPTGADLLGTTTNTSWDLPQLLPDTDYYWRIYTRQGSDLTVGPTWQFHTSPLGPLDHFSFNTIPSPQTAGQPIPVTITARDAAHNLIPNFNQPVSLVAAAPTDPIPYTLLDGSTETAFVSYDRSTVGYTFTPSTNIVVTHLRHFSGDKISIWTDAGILLHQQNVRSVNRSWTQTPLSTPLTLNAGDRYRIGVYSGGNTIHYTRFDRLPAFPHGTLLQSYTATGDAFPQSPHPARWWFVDLVYQVAIPQITTPAATGAFSNGTWSGNVTINTTAANVSLHADDGNGHSGFSNPFDAEP